MMGKKKQHSNNKFTKEEKAANVSALFEYLAFLKLTPKASLEDIMHAKEVTSNLIQNAKLEDTPRYLRDVESHHNFLLSKNERIQQPISKSTIADVVKETKVQLEEREISKKYEGNVHLGDDTLTVKIRVYSDYYLFMIDYKSEGKKLRLNWKFNEEGRIVYISRIILKKHVDEAKKRPTILKIRGETPKSEWIYASASYGDIMIDMESLVPGLMRLSFLETYSAILKYGHNTAGLVLDAIKDEQNIWPYKKEKSEKPLINILEDKHAIVMIEKTKTLEPTVERIDSDILGIHYEPKK